MLKRATATSSLFALTFVALLVAITIVAIYGAATKTWSYWPDTPNISTAAVPLLPPAKAVIVKEYPGIIHIRTADADRGRMHRFLDDDIKRQGGWRKPSALTRRVYVVPEAYAADMAGISINHGPDPRPDLYADWVRERQQHPYQYRGAASDTEVIVKITHLGPVPRAGMKIALAIMGMAAGVCLFGFFVADRIEHCGGRTASADRRLHPA